MLPDERDRELRARMAVLAPMEFITPEDTPGRFRPGMTVFPPIRKKEVAQNPNKG